MNVYIASDHAGFKLKQNIKKRMKSLVDLTQKFVEGDDYPLVAKKLCKKLKKQDKGILICGSGVGVCIAANKFKGIRAALCSTVKCAELSRLHNDANVLCLPGRYLTTVKALKIIKKWLSTPFSAFPRHVKRIDQIKSFEKWR
ncbi:ribose-5-phosphate isomerase [Candidatus Woesearchaeota archaeon]|nr:MAG: ribose-5-phosphate isomerase [Candidatus Woesearchaeota archaeon]